MSTLAQTLRRNSLFALTSSVIRLASNAVLFILVARFYGPEAFGQFTTAHTLATIFILIADFGFDLFLITEIARQREATSHLLPRMLGVKLGLSLVASALMCIVPSLYEMSTGTRDLTYIFSLYLFFSALLNFLFALFKGHDEFHHESFITLSLNLALLGMLVVMGLTGVNLYLVAAAFVASRILGLVLALRRASRFAHATKPIFDLPWLRSVWKKASVFGLFFIFGNLYFLLDTILLSMWRGDYEVGIYQSVFRLVALALVIVEITVNAVLPSLSRFWEDERERWHQLGALANRSLYYIGLLLGFVCVAGAETIIGLIYGLDEYSDAVLILRIFGFIIAVRYSVEIPALMLTTSLRQHVRMLIVLAATIFNFLLNAYAIPRYGMAGAAVVSLLTNISVGLAYIFAVRDFFRDRWFSLQRMVALFIIFMGGVAVVALPELPAWLNVLGVAIVYILVIYATGYSLEEKRTVFQKTAWVEWS